MTSFFQQSLIIVLCLWLIGCQPHSVHQPLIEGKIQRVVSGQTLDVIIQNQSYRVRLIGLEVPDNPPELSQKAEEKLTALLTDNGQIPLNSITVFLETNLQEKDSFDRIFAYVWYDQKLLNQKIIENGSAIALLTYTDGRYDTKLTNAQNYARIMEKGLWSNR